MPISLIHRIDKCMTMTDKIIKCGLSFLCSPFL